VNEVNLYNAWLKLERLTEQAMEDEAIKKPITWALYNVWKWADKNEKPRKGEE
jgi:hypothetical protein